MPAKPAPKKEEPAKKEEAKPAAAAEAAPKAQKAEKKHEKKHKEEKGVRAMYKAEGEKVSRSTSNLRAMWTRIFHGQITMTGTLAATVDLLVINRNKQF